MAQTREKTMYLRTIGYCFVASLAKRIGKAVSVSWKTNPVEIFFNITAEF